MNSQLNLFGEEIPANEVTKTKKQKRKRPAPTPIKDTQQLPKNRPLKICYARYYFDVSVEERTDLQNQAAARGSGVTELDIIREQLERQFPELSKERVTWHWDAPKENENAENQLITEPLVIVPVVTAGKKGAF
jgi:hypothetical protein